MPNALAQFGRLVLQSKGPPYIGYTTRHLLQRYRTSASGRDKGCHGVRNPKLAITEFSVLRKCLGKLDCQIYEMLLIPLGKKTEHSIRPDSQKLFK